MLKWAISKRPESTDKIFPDNMVQSAQIKSRRSISESNKIIRARELRECRRKLKCLSENSKNPSNKENDNKSTPQQHSVHHQNHFYTARRNLTTMTSTPLPNKIPDQPLRDVGNVTPNLTSISVNVTPILKLPLPKSPNSSPHTANNLQMPQYAATLPTFDVEYSPTCGPPDIAIRNYSGIPKLLKNQRYFVGDCSKPNDTIKDPIPHMSLGSSALNDTDLEKMIDAIIDSENMDNNTKSPDNCHLRRQNALRRKNTRLDSERPYKHRKLNASPVPITPVDLILTSFINKNLNQITDHLDTPRERSFESTPGIGEDCSTPCLIRKCLVYPDSPESKPNVSTPPSASLRYVKSNNCSGSVDVAISVNNKKIHVHVIRCKDLSRSIGGSVNAYVKVSIVPNISTNCGFQRTAVHRNSIRPFFDHRFVFNLNDNHHLTNNNRIQLAVWHRDREYKRSEFLGCISFPLTDLSTDKEISGSFKLQSQNSLMNHFDYLNSINNNLNAISNISGSSNKELLYQREAEKLSFLSLLDLDRYQTTKLDIDRYFSNTPFTLTKLITKSTNNCFGFTVIWTSPPRVDEVTDAEGIMSGDYIIFINKINIVSMTKRDILNLIESNEDHLNLEIFRFRDVKGISSHSYSNLMLYSTESNTNKVAFTEDVGQGVIV